MKLSVSQLRSFKTNCSPIKANNILPVLSFLKFDKGSVTKSSLHSFVTQEIDCKESFLVDERILMNFVTFTNAKEIDVKVEGKKVTLSDGKTNVVSMGDDVEIFPKHDEPTSTVKEIGFDILESIGVASNFVNEGDVPDARMYVFVGNKYVCGSNGHIAYVNEFKQELPQMVLEKNIASLISKFESVEFSENETFTFFDVGECKYGFVKPVYPFFDESSFGKFEKGNKFIINKGEFVSVNEMAINSTLEKFPIASISVKDKKLHFEMNDVGYEVTIKNEMDVDGEDVDSFNFNPSLMSKFLKAVPDTQLTFYKVNNRYYVTGESGFVSLLMGLQ